ncbi:MAG: hypothetical protein ACPGO3_11545 [Magnetospiraceae bacterium]
MKRRWALIGIVFSLLGVAFIGWRLATLDIDWAAFSASPEIWIALGGAAALFTLTGVSGGIGWHLLLRCFARRTPTVIDNAGLVCFSQIGKYLPTNLVHFLGRHLLLKKWGVDHSPLLMAFTAEALVTASAVGLAGFMGGGQLFLDVLGAHMTLGTAALAVAGFAGLCGAAFMANRVINLKLELRDPKSLLARGMAAFCLYLLNMGILGIMGLSLLGSVGAEDMAFSWMVAVVSISWLVGFITPGASAGLGVRDALMVLMLEIQLSPEAALQATLLFRAATVFGDLLVFALGWAWWQQRGKQLFAAEEASSPAANPGD